MNNTPDVDLLREDDGSFAMKPDPRTLVVASNYTPRKWQYWVHGSSKRFNVLVVHRRGGKTIISIAEMRDRCLRNKLNNPHYAYIAPTYGQAKRVAWEYFKAFFKNIPGVDFKEGDLKVEIPRPEYDDVISVWLIGGDNPKTILGMYLDGVIMDEYSEMNPIIWSQVVRPALSDRKGWAFFIGTPHGEDHFYDIHSNAKKLMEMGKDWFTCLLTVEKTGEIDAEELEEARLTMTEDEFNQEFMCDFNAALTGAYFSDLMVRAKEEGRIGDLPYDPRYPVVTAWDLGISDSMAVWFIQKPIGSNYYHVIDYFEFNGKGIDYYIQELQKKGYYYAKYLMPHDAKQREFSTGKSRMDTFAKKGIRDYEIVPKVGNKADAIHAVREILPLCKFDEKKCSIGLSALKNYQREYDAKNKMYKDKPKHDWTSHGSDAFQTFARGVRPDNFIGSDIYNKTLPSTAEIEYTEY